MSHCGPIQERLNALLDRELSVADWVRVRLHLITCAKCRSRLAEYQRLTVAAQQVRAVQGRRKWRHLVPAISFAAVAIVVCVVSFYPHPKVPQAIVYDQAALMGNLRPTSAFYAEGNSLVLRDTYSGAMLARSPGHTRRDAFNALSLASRVPTSQPKEFRVELDQPIPDIDPNTSVDIILLEPGDVSIQQSSPTVIFFSGEPNDLKELNIQSKGPMFFVKVIDPQFFIDMNKALPTEKFVLPPNKKPSTVNR